jgi:hypothetical protein
MPSWYFGPPPKPVHARALAHAAHRRAGGIPAPGSILRVTEEMSVSLIPAWMAGIHRPRMARSLHPCGPDPGIPCRGDDVASLITRIDWTLQSRTWFKPRAAEPDCFEQSRAPVPSTRMPCRMNRRYGRFACVAPQGNAAAMRYLTPKAAQTARSARPGNLHPVPSCRNEDVALHSPLTVSCAARLPPVRTDGR